MLNLKHIRFYAESKGRSLRSLAKELGMSPNGFNQAIDNNTLSAEYAIQVCHILGISIYDLVESNEGISVPPRENKELLIKSFTEDQLKTAVEVFAELVHTLDKNKK